MLRTFLSTCNGRIIYMYADINHNKGSIQLFVSLYILKSRRKASSSFASLPGVVLIAALHHVLNQLIILHIFILIYIHSYIIIILGCLHVLLRLSRASKTMFKLIRLFARPIRDLRLRLGGCEPKVTSRCAPDPRPRIFRFCFLHRSLPSGRKSIALKSRIAGFWYLIGASRRCVTVWDGAERTGTP